MKKLFCIGLIGTMLLSGCAGGNASSQERAETKPAETKPAETSIAEIDMAEGEGLNAIVYNGTCYYGVAFYGSESYVPSDAKLLGKAADSSECLSISLYEQTPVPTEELQTNCADPGTDVYAVFGNSGNVIEFYTSTDGEHGYTYYILKDLTTEMPEYYTAGQGRTETLKKRTAAGQSFFVGKLNSFLECRLSKITIYAGYAESTRKYLQKGAFFGII